jgi:hypothetical protein
MFYKDKNVSGVNSYIGLQAGVATTSALSTPTLCVTNANNVGIGTASPKGRLEVADVSQLTNAGQWLSSTISMKQVGGFIGDYSQIVFGYHSNTQTNGSAYIGYLATNQGANGFGDLVFGTRSVNTDTQPTERMRITSTGNVLIGATALAVNEKVRIGGEVGANSPSLAITSANTPVSVPSGVATTVYTFPTQSRIVYYTVFVRADTGSNVSQYGAMATIGVSLGTARVMSQVKGSILTLTISGLDLQVNQGSGATQTYMTNVTQHFASSGF